MPKRVLVFIYIIILFKKFIPHFRLVLFPFDILMHHVHYYISSPVPSSPSAVLHYPAVGENNTEKVLCWHQRHGI